MATREEREEEYYQEWLNEEETKTNTGDAEMRFETTATDNFGKIALDLNFDNVVEKSTQLLNIMTAPSEGHSFRIRSLTYFDGSPIPAEDMKHSDKVSYEFKNGSWVDEKGFEVTKKDIEIAIWQTLDAMQEQFRGWQQHA